MNNEEKRLLIEASIKFREAKKLEFRLHKIIQDGYELLMKAIYPSYKSPQELKSIRENRMSNIGDNSDNSRKLESIKKNKTTA